MAGEKEIRLWYDLKVNHILLFMIQYPNFLIVGASRAGTTSLYYYLNQDPEIFMSIRKEPCFLCFAEKQVKFSNEKSNFIVNHDEYIKLFEKAKGYKAIGEASTPYLYFYESTIRNIYQIMRQ